MEEGRRYSVVRKAARMGGRRDVIRASRVVDVFGLGFGGGFDGGVGDVLVVEDLFCRAT